MQYTSQESTSRHPKATRQSIHPKNTTQKLKTINPNYANNTKKRKAFDITKTKPKTSPNTTPTSHPRHVAEKQKAATRSG